MIAVTSCHNKRPSLSFSHRIFSFALVPHHAHWDGDDAVVMTMNVLARIPFQSIPTRSKTPGRLPFRPSTNTESPISKSRDAFQVATFVQNIHVTGVPKDDEYRQLSNTQMSLLLLLNRPATFASLVVGRRGGGGGRGSRRRRVSTTTKNSRRVGRDAHSFDCTRRGL